MNEEATTFIYADSWPSISSLSGNKYAFYPAGISRVPFKGEIHLLLSGETQKGQSILLALFPK